MRQSPWPGPLQYERRAAADANEAKGTDDTIVMQPVECLALGAQPLGVLRIERQLEHTLLAVVANEQRARRRSFAEPPGDEVLAAVIVEQHIVRSQVRVEWISQALGRRRHLVLDDV